MSATLRFASLALSLPLLFATAGCAKHDESAARSSASSAPSSSTPADLSRLGVPVYPHARARNGTMLDVTTGGVRTEVATLLSDDDFTTVDGWYQTHVDSAYKATHVSLGTVRNSSYTLGTPRALPIREIIVSPNTDASTGKETATILVMVKEKP